MGCSLGCEAFLCSWCLFHESMLLLANLRVYVSVFISFLASVRLSSILGPCQVVVSGLVLDGMHLLSIHEG